MNEAHLCACGCGGLTKAAEIFALRTEGLSHREIGQRLGVSHAHVGQYLRKPPRYLRGHAPGAPEWDGTWRICEFAGCGRHFKPRGARRVCNHPECQGARWRAHMLAGFAAPERDELQQSIDRAELDRLIDDQALELEVAEYRVNNTFFGAARSAHGLSLDADRVASGDDGSEFSLYSMVPAPLPDEDES